MMWLRYLPSRWSDGPTLGEVWKSASDDLGHQIDQVALFLHVERLQCLARDGRSVDQQLVHQALPLRGEAEQGAARVAGVGTRIDQAAFLETTHHTLHRRLLHPDETAHQVFPELR